MEYNYNRFICDRLESVERISVFTKCNCVIISPKPGEPPRDGELYLCKIRFEPDQHCSYPTDQYHILASKELNYDAPDHHVWSIGMKGSPIIFWKPCTIRWHARLVNDNND